MSNTDPCSLCRLLYYRGKTCVFMGRKPCSQGRKNPNLPCLSIAAALQAYSYVLSSLDIRTPQELLLPSPAYLKLGFTMSQLGHTNQSPCACCFLLFSYILTVPYILSLVNYYYIHLAPSPPKAIKGVRGIYPF